MLTKKVLQKINNTVTRLKLAIALDVTEMTIRNYITDNSDNLTKAAALKVIREETGLAEADILEIES